MSVRTVAVLTICGLGLPPVGSDVFAQAGLGAANRVSTTKNSQILVQLSPEDATAANLFDLDGKTLVFMPDGRGGYSRSVQPLAWEEDLGEETSEGEEIALGFAFDFGGRSWDSAYVSKHGALIFGAPLGYWYDDPQNRFDTMAEIAAKFVTHPTVSPLFKPGYGGITGRRDPLASQFVARQPDRVVVTWFASEPHFYDAFPQETPDRFQAVLSADGTVRFHYGLVDSGDGIAGLFPYGNGVPRGDAIAMIADPRNPELPGHLDLLEVGIYEAGGSAVIVEFTTREPIPEPDTGTRFSYRLAVDADDPYWPKGHWDHRDAEFEWRIVLRAEGAHYAKGGGILRREGNQIAMVGDIPQDLAGIPISIVAQVACYDNPSCEQGDDSVPARVELPRTETVDLSRSDDRFIARQSEVFHYRGAPDTVKIACRVIAHFGDVFDMFMFHNEFRIDSQENATPSGRTFGALPIGIGVDDHRLLPAPCGAGRLKKALMLPILSQNLDEDLGVNSLTHEFVHLWSAYLSFATNGERETLTTGYNGIHWRGELHSPAAFLANGRSTMGGSVWNDNGDGTFTPGASSSGLSWLDLYAMGLAKASEVPDMFILRNLKAVVEGHHNPRGETYRGGVYTGDKEIVSIEQVLAAEGPRRPGAGESQRDFNLGFVYLVEPGQAPSADLLDAHAQLVRQFPANWSRITGGRSRLLTPLPDGAAEGPCVANAETLCLHGDRYEVRVEWRTGDGETGSAQVVPEATEDSGLFRFFDADNWEILIKVLDGCAVNGHYWVYGASTTDLGYVIRVTDTATGDVQEYRNEAGRPAAAITDAKAFPTSCRQ